jgi:signal transduction histidine kinase
VIAGRWRRAGLRQRVRLAFLGVALVGALGLVFVAVTFADLIDARVRLADRLDPAGFQARRWVSAVVDQDSGVRGYALTGDETFLEPYRTGEREAASAERSVRRLLADEPALLSSVEDFTADTASWRADSAEPLIAQTAAQGAEAAAEDDLRRSKTSFDELRTTYDRFQRRLDEARQQARHRLDRHTTDLARATVAVVLLATAGLVATWVGLNRSVLAPIASLGRDARKVASGELRHEVAAAGPPDLQHLAGDMEAMRRRIVEELALVEEARRQLEEQAADLTRSNRELEQFAYVASHDLQEPLRKVTGFCQLLQRRYGGQLDERADEYIAFAVDGAKRMQTLINDLLAFSRVGRTTETFQQVDLAVVASAARHTLDDVVTEAGATVEIGPLPSVEGDPSLLELLFQNLIGNAIKFRGAEPPVVTISSRPNPEGDGYELSCTDNGIGIEPAYAERVFVIFQRLHAREAYEGTGIGLALCRKIVEFHGGRIRVEPPAPSGGTTITWTLASRLVHEQPEDPTVGDVVADATDTDLAPIEVPTEEPV